MESHKYLNTTGNIERFIASYSYDANYATLYPFALSRPSSLHQLPPSTVLENPDTAELQ